MITKEETRQLLRKYGDELLAGLEKSVSPWQLENLNKLVDETIEEVLAKTAEELAPYEGLDFSALENLNKLADETIKEVLAKTDVIPSMSMRMVGDKIHSFSIDEDSFKNGLKPDEVTPQLPKGPLDGHKSWVAENLKKEIADILKGEKSDEQTSEEKA